MVGVEIEDETEIETNEHGDPVYCVEAHCRHLTASSYILCKCCLDDDAERCVYTAVRQAVEKLIAHFKLSEVDACEVRTIAGV